ncbi:MAG: nucleotidyltransferase domain-containing protein [Undibacterium sp.]|nr:nucleotidyltransferase domain-containing protein [Opitutaceae bacterium]
MTAAKIFGSRARGTHAPHSATDLVLWGEVDALKAEALAAEPDELPLPCHYDVRPFASIKPPSLREHIERVGVMLRPELVRAKQWCPVLDMSTGE